MGVHTLPLVVAALLAEGRDPGTLLACVVDGASSMPEPVARTSMSSTLKPAAPAPSPRSASGQVAPPPFDLPRIGHGVVEAADVSGFFRLGWHGKTGMPTLAYARAAGRMESVALAGDSEAAS